MREVDRNDDLVDAYYQLLRVHNGTAVRERAAVEWCRWEDAASPLPGGVSNPRYEDSAFRTAFARIVTHYFRHRAWLSDDELLRNADRLAGIPAVLVHGRFDLGGPVDSAWQLARAWPGAQLVLVETGHTAPTTEPAAGSAGGYSVLAGWEQSVRLIAPRHAGNARSLPSW